MFYSQDKQDSFLENNIFKGYKNGFFMDIGAYDGIAINNTLYFEKNNNWTGVNVEPLEIEYNKLVKNRPSCININCAVTNFNGEADFISNTTNTAVLSGLQLDYDKRHLQRLMRENNESNSISTIIKINTRTIESICDEYNIKHINYLSIDVEGAEFNVIKSINFDKVFIDVIGFENNYNDVSIPIVAYLRNKNYVLINTPNSLDIFMIHKDSFFYKKIKNQ